MQNLKELGVKEMTSKQKALKFLINDLDIFLDDHSKMKESDWIKIDDFRIFLQSLKKGDKKK